MSENDVPYSSGKSVLVAKDLHVLWLSGVPTES